jgi:hypothetical protein
MGVSATSTPTAHPVMITAQQHVEMARLDYQDFREEAAARLRIMEALGLALLKGLTLANGGALIALFTFIGNVGPKSIGINTQSIWYAFAWFVGGLVASMVANLCAYFMQNFFYLAVLDQAWVSQARSIGSDRAPDHDRPYKLGSRWEGGAILASVIGLIAFCVGSGIALAGAIGR